MRVLVVDDDAETLEVVGRALEKDGHRISAVQTPEAALAVLESTNIELIVLDVMLEEASGLDLCARIRHDGLEVPILFLSARGTVNARVEGLDAGGDDYLAKPFALRELAARVRALGRRGPAIHRNAVAIGALTLDFEACRAAASGEEIRITRREWDILQVLANARGRVVSFDNVLEHAWGQVTESSRASLEVIVSRLRKKLDGPADRCLIRTARGLGYSLELEE